MAVNPPLNPILMLLEGNGSLQGRDRAGIFSATGSGALRYAAAPGARINYFQNPSFENATLNPPLLTNPGATFERSSDFALDGSYSLKCTATSDVAETGAYITSTSLNIANQLPSYYGAITVSVSWYIYHQMSGTKQFQSRIGGTNGAAVTVPAGVWTRVSHSTALAAGQAAVPHIGRMINVTTGDVWYVDCVQIEISPAPTAWIGGGVNGAVWLDPLTGMLGTPHASPSVSRAQFWVEEATTNVLTNPSFEIALTGHWSAYGGGVNTLTQMSTAAFLGANSVRCQHDGSIAGQGITTHASNRPAVSSGQTWTASVRVRGTGTITLWLVERDGGGVGVGQSSQAITLTSAWQYVTVSRTLNGAGVATLETRLSTATAVAVDMYVDCWQLEQKAYATSYADGSIGTGYAFVGTAHASASTRATTLVEANTTNRISSVEGSWISRLLQPADNGRYTSYLYAGNYNVGDWIAMSLPTNEAITTRFRTSPNEQAAASGASVFTYGTRHNMYGSWAAARLGVAMDGLSVVYANRLYAVSGTITNTIRLGGSGAEYANAYQGPLAVYETELSDARRAMANAAIDSNGATDLWALFEEWEGIIQPADLLALQSGQATAGVKAELAPIDLLPLQSGRATAGVTAEVEVLDMSMMGEELVATARRPFPYLVTWRSP